MKYKVQFGGIIREVDTYEAAWELLQSLLHTFKQGDYAWAKRLNGRKQWKLINNSRFAGFAFILERREDDRWWALT